MKRIIAGMIGAAVLGGAVVAQEVTFYNKLGGTLVHKPAAWEGEYEDVYTSELYDEMRGTYDSEKFSFWGNLKLGLKPSYQDQNGKWTKPQPKGNGDWIGPWDLGASGFVEPRFAAAFRPLPFLEVIGDYKAAGEEGLWSAKYLPGAYGYGSDIHYGLSKWAKGGFWNALGNDQADAGLIVALRGEGIGVDGLTAGWKVLEGPLYKYDASKDEKQSVWSTAMGVSYVTEVFGIGFGAQLSTEKDANQRFGIYGEITAVENLKVGLGATMHTDATSWGFNNVTATWWNGTSNYGGYTREGDEEEFTAALNVGAEYSFAGMGLPLLVGADFAMLAGERTVFDVKTPNNDSVSYTVMPMVVGGFVSFGVMENLILDLRVVWETDNGKYSGKKEYEADAKELAGTPWKTSLLTVEPRVTFLLTEADEFRLDVPVYYWTKDDADATGVDLELYWKHFF